MAVLAEACTDLGSPHEGLKCATRACALAPRFPADYKLQSSAFGGLAYANWCLGRPEGAYSAARELLRLGELHGNKRCLVYGFWAMGLGHLAGGDFDAVVAAAEAALNLSEDPWFSQFPRFFGALGFFYAGRFNEAREHLAGISEFSRDRGTESLGIPSRGILGATLVALGRLDEGMRTLEETQRSLTEAERAWGSAQATYIVGALYARVARRAAPLPAVRVLLRNPRFLFRDVPGAGRRAHRILEKGVADSLAIGASGMAGQCHLELGELCRAEGRRGQAAEHYREATALFESCGADVFVARVREAAASLATEEVRGR